MHSLRDVRLAMLCSTLLTVVSTASAQVSPLDQARAAYAAADFRSALEILETVERQGIDRAAQADALELRATLLFALREDGWRAALGELAGLDPDHAMPSRLPPQLLSQWQLARAERARPNETRLARARAAYVVADFEGTLRILGALGPEATAAQQVERLVLEALARFGLRDLDGTGRTLEELATLSPDHRFGPGTPPAFRRAWDRARRQPGSDS